MTNTEQRAAARQFSADWEGRGDEKQQTQAFWLALLPKGLCCLRAGKVHLI